MSQEKGAGLTTGFTTEAERRRESDHHESVYADKNILMPTLAITGACILGFLVALVSF